MRLHRLEREQSINRLPADVFEFFAKAENLERITPPWLSFRLLTPGPIEMGRGTLIDYRLRLHGLPLRWVSRIEVWEEGCRFVDQQVRGPYRFWRHLHEFLRVGQQTTRVRDRVEYALPLGRLGDVLGMPVVRRDLVRIFDYRQAAVARLLPPPRLPRVRPNTPSSAEPWTMPEAAQRDAGCVIGEDYPAPIVDHAVARREALARYGEAARAPADATPSG